MRECEIASGKMRTNSHSFLPQGVFTLIDAGWSSLAARRAHNPKVAGSNPAPATRGPLHSSTHFDRR